MLYSRRHVVVKEKMKGRLIFFSASIMLLGYSTIQAANYRYEDRISQFPVENSDPQDTQNGIFSH